MSDEQPDDALAARIRSDVPHSARVWNYWMGGRDNYPADRAAGDAVRAVYPEVVAIAKQSRRFLVRAVRHLAGDLGVRQFLDIGTGLPTMQNTHEVAQAVQPGSRVVYVDNDPLVLEQARALLGRTAPEGVVRYLDADYHDPERIVAEAGRVLDLRRPVAVIFMGVLGHVADFLEMRSIVARSLAAVSSGSYLLLWDSTRTSVGIREGEQVQAKAGVPYALRELDQLRECFAGLELVEPGLVPINHWGLDRGEALPAPLDAHGGLGRMP